MIYPVHTGCGAFFSRSVYEFKKGGKIQQMLHIQQPYNIYTVYTLNPHIVKKNKYELTLRRDRVTLLETYVKNMD